MNALSKRRIDSDQAARWTAYLTSPWQHPEALPAIRDALRLRLRLMP